MEGTINYLEGTLGEVCLGEEHAFEADIKRGGTKST